MDDLDFVSREHRFWFACLNLIGAAVLLGLGYVFLAFGLGSSNAVASVLAYLAAAFFDIQALPFLGVGFYQLYRCVKG